MGCEESMIRKNKRKHEEEHMEEHLLMTKAKLNKTETRLSALEMMVNNFISKAGSGDRMITSGHSSIHLATSSTLTCPVTVKMSRYSSYKSSITNWCSDPFYSHNRGYKMYLMVDASGYGNGVCTHMSVFLFLTKSQYDNELKWPLRGKFAIKVLNQICDHECDHENHTCTVTYDNNTSDTKAGRIMGDEQTVYGHGETQFISNADLNKVTPTCQYLKDDCIFLQVSKL